MKTETTEIGTCSYTAWTWLGSKDNKPQSELFGSADAAMAGMQKRMGKDFDLNDIIQYGFRLTMVEVTLRPTMVMSKVIE